MNLIDGIVRAFSPESALKRARAREFLRIVDSTGFRREAAKTSTNRKTADQLLDRPDSGTNHTDRLQLIREARWLEENSSVIKSFLRKYRTFAVGRAEDDARRIVGEQQAHLVRGLSDIRRESGGFLLDRSGERRQRDEEHGAFRVS